MKLFVGAVFITAVFSTNQGTWWFWPEKIRKLGCFLINHSYFCRGKTTWVSVCRPLTSWNIPHDIPSRKKLRVCYLKMDGWNMLVSSWDFSDFQGRSTVGFWGVTFDVLEHPLPTKDFQSDSRQTVLHENPQGTRRDRPVNRKRSTFPVRQLLMWFRVSFLTYLSYFLSYIKRKPLL